MANPIAVAWTVRGVSSGSGKTSALLTCAACRKSFEVQATTMAGCFVRLQTTMTVHVFEAHPDVPRPAPSTPDDTLQQCGYRGYRANDDFCRYERGHDGPCQWSQGD